MKKEKLLKFLPPLLVIAMFALFFGGALSGNAYLVFIFMGVVFGGGFIVAIACVIKMFIMAKKYNDSIEAEHRRDNDTASKEYINNTRHNSTPMAVRQIANWLQALKLAEKGDIVKGCLFVTTFIGCLVAFVVVAALGYGAWCILPWGIGCGMIIIALIVTKIIEHRSAGSKRVNKNMPAVKATVIGCYVNSESYVSSGTRRYNQTHHIINTTYRVLLDVDGKKVSAFSKKFYNEGEEVYVRPVGKKYVHIEED